MNRKNLFIILLIDLVIIAGTGYLIMTRYNDYKTSMKTPLSSTIDMTAKKTPEKPPQTQQAAKTEAKPFDKKETNETREAPVFRNIRFEYKSSGAKVVSLIGDFNDWTPQAFKKSKKNTWEIMLKLQPGKYRYNYIVNGKVVRDPYNISPPEDSSRGFNSSVLIVKNPKK